MREKLTRRELLKLGLLAGGGSLVAAGCRALGIEDKQLSATKPTEVSARSELLEKITETASSSKEPALIDKAVQIAEGKWELQNADGERQEIVLPEGFTPDVRLRIHTQPDTFEEPLPLPADTTAFADFQRALNTKRPDGTPPLAGYDSSIESGDYCNNPPDNQCTAQLNMYSWKIFTGEEIDVPGIGSLKGGENRAVAVLLLNRDKTVHAWDGEAPVRVEHGFTGGGPLWDGQKNIEKAEQGLVAHFADRLLHGIDGMYRGACDNPDNCAEVLFVSAQRRQWGDNPDGSPRLIFELLRAEVIGK